MIIKKCSNCDLCLNNNFTPVKPYIGRLSNIMIVLDMPTHADKKKGMLLDSISNKLLKTLLFKHGLLHLCYVTSVIKCKPIVNNVTKINLIKCRPYLLEEIKMYKPNIIITFGKLAFESFYPNKTYNVNKINGKYTKIGNTYVISFANVNYFKIDKNRVIQLDNYISMIEQLMTKINPMYKWY